MKKKLIGIVKSAKMTNSAVVVVDRIKAHPLYLKRTKTSKSYLVDNKVKAKEGDRVSIEETKPLSRRKRWQIIKVLK